MIEGTSVESQAHLRLMAILRGLNEKAVTLNTDATTFQNLIEQAEQLSCQFGLNQGDPIESFYKAISKDGDDNGTQPYSLLGGRHNPASAPLRFKITGDGRLSAEVTFGKLHEGPPGYVHGGIISGVFDYVLAATCSTVNKSGPTAYLNVRFLKPVPLHTVVSFDALLDKSEGRKVFVRGNCNAGGEILADADGLFIHIPPDYFDRAGNG